MSKQQLQHAAFELGGVSYAESCQATEPSFDLFNRIGGIPGFQELTQRFYDRVFSTESTKDATLTNIFASSSKAEAHENLYKFLVQTFGGPALYAETKGKYTRLVGRHANYNIGREAARQWLSHMKVAIQDHSKLHNDTEAQNALNKYFVYTAHYIVVAKQYMRSDQLSGGKVVDPGRIW